MIFDEGEDDRCPICKAPMTSGWLCLDGSGLEICTRHITIKGR
jgi:hypothetical protein